MAGCDYLDNMKGISFLRVLRVYQNGNHQEGIQNLFSTLPNKEEVDNYLKKVPLVMNCFVHQLVYNQHAKRESDKLVNLNPIEKKYRLGGEYNIEDYIGTWFKNVDSYAKGERCFQNEEEFRKQSDVNFEQVMRFFNYLPRPHLGFLGNLCESTIGYNNFSDYSDFLKKNQDDNYQEVLKKRKEEVIERCRKLLEKRHGRVEKEEKSLTTLSESETPKKKRICKIRNSRGYKKMGSRIDEDSSFEGDI